MFNLLYDKFQATIISMLEQKNNIIKKKKLILILTKKSLLKNIQS